MATVPSTLEEIFEVDLEKSGKSFTTAWTSDGSGAYTEAGIIFRGWLVEIEFIPGTAGSQPSDLYDVELRDANSRNVLLTPQTDAEKASIGADLPQSSTYVFPHAGSGKSIIKYLNGTYSIVISNAGNAKSGTIVWKIKNR